MLQAACKFPLSPEDYLAGESFAEVRHEYVGGEVYAMSGTRKPRIPGCASSSSTPSRRQC